MEKIKLSQTVLVEGRYDKARLSGLVDAQILTTDGFAIFKDKKKLEMLRQLAQKNGLVIVTDSDRAGFRIRSYIGGSIQPQQVTHVYIPDIMGKERRKTAPAKEGKLGVEGIPNHILWEAFRKAGLTGQQDANHLQQNPACDQNPDHQTNAQEVFTTADMVAWGLSGGTGSFERRRQLQKSLNLPERLSSKSLLGVLNKLCTREQVEQMLHKDNH